MPLHACAPTWTTPPPEAKTTYGIIGVKVWVYKGEVKPGQVQAEPVQPEKKSSKGRVASCCNQRLKYRKQQKAATPVSPPVATKVSFGDFGLKAVGRGRLTARQIEAARRAMTRHIKRGGKSGSVCSRTSRFLPSRPKFVWVTWGKYYVAETSPGVLYEMDGVGEELAREAFRLAAAKLPIPTTFVVRQVGQ